MVAFEDQGSMGQWAELFGYVVDQRTHEQRGRSVPQFPVKADFSGSFFEEWPMTGIGRKYRMHELMDEDGEDFGGLIYIGAND